MNPETIKMAEDILRDFFPTPLRLPYVVGRTEFRDLLYEKLGCSFLEAEALVDMLERTGRIHYRRRNAAGGQNGIWKIA